MQRLTAYALDLELEVDRLRRTDQFVQRQAADYLDQIKDQCRSAATADQARFAAIAANCEHCLELLRDLDDPQGYVPAFDKVIVVPVRPLAEQVFRWQQRLQSAPRAELRLDLGVEQLAWFPARLRHILENLFSNALRYRDAEKGETRVGLSLVARSDAYEVRVTDNGRGMPPDQLAGILDLSYRAAPGRAAGLGVGLAVVKLLVEQSCGSIALTSGEGQGTSVVVTLPRFDVDDHIA